MFLPQLFKINDTYRVYISLIGWKYYNSEWMDNPDMPVGEVYQPDTDVTITSVVCNTEKEAFIEFKNMTAICEELNNITDYSYKNCITTAVSYLKNHLPKLIITK